MSNFDEKTETQNTVRLARKMLGKSLGIDLGRIDFGHIIGYDGKNVFQTIRRLENGGSGISGPVALRLGDLMQAASYVFHHLLVVPEWSFIIPFNESEEDGSTVMIERRWYPRMVFVATVQAQGSLDDLNFQHVGMIRTDDPDLEEMSVWCLHQDILPNLEWYTKFYEQGIAMLTEGINDQVLDM